jgi:hypothetical protein
MLTTDGRGSPEYAQALHFNPVVCWSKELDKYMHASFLYCWNTVVHTFASIKPIRIVNVQTHLRLIT